MGLWIIYPPWPIAYLFSFCLSGGLRKDIFPSSHLFFDLVTMKSGVGQSQWDLDSFMSSPLWEGSVVSLTKGMHLMSQQSTKESVDGLAGTSDGMLGGDQDLYCAIVKYFYEMVRRIYNGNLNVVVVQIKCLLHRPFSTCI